MSDKPASNTHSTRIDPYYKRPAKDTRGKYHAQLNIQRLASKCAGCGARVIHPCHKCYIDSLKGSI